MDFKIFFFQIGKDDTDGFKQSKNNRNIGKRLNHPLSATTDMSSSKFYPQQMTPIHNGFIVNLPIMLGAFLLSRKISIGVFRSSHSVFLR